MEGIASFLAALLSAPLLHAAIKLPTVTISNTFVIVILFDPCKSRRNINNKVLFLRL
jgi:hypothetical protein